VLPYPTVRVQNVNVQVNNNVNNLDININNAPRDSVTSNAELKAVLAKYIKSKLPTQLHQKNPCLYTTEESCNKIEFADHCCKSVDVKVNIRDDIDLNRINSK
jgi:hypothetical protein